MTQVDCPSCGAEFDASEEALFLFNRFYCSACNALLEVIEEEPLIIEAIDGDEFDAEELDAEADEVAVDDDWDED